MKSTVISNIAFVALVAAAAGCTADANLESDAERGALFMDVHDLGAGNVTAEAVAEAHEADLRVQDEYGVRFLRYWVDEEQGKVYCLSEAPNAQAIVDTHRAAHGLLPNTVSEVTAGQ
jgi:hypothetical protein